MDAWLHPLLLLWGNGQLFKMYLDLFSAIFGAKEQQQLICKVRLALQVGKDF